MTDKITFKCAKCGSKLFKHPANPKPNDVVTCSGCGAKGKYSDVMATARKVGIDAVKKAFGKALKNSGLK